MALGENLCGLLGQVLHHSYSPRIHSELGDYPFMLFPLDPQNLGYFFRTMNFAGLNVTIPYKKTVISYCDELSETAERLGAVNTIIRRADGSLYGHNTDYFGFQYMLDKSGLKVFGKKVLVLGSGGASATVKAVLEEAGANVVIISRSGENNYNNLYLHEDAAVIVNTTPVGTYPETGVSPIPLSPFSDLEGVLDLTYNPARTELLMDAEERGLITMNGLWMLVAQAKESSELFTGTKISDSVIEEIYHKVRRETENIVLVGMPGCGKSRLSRILAYDLRRKVVDIDSVIEEKAGMTIQQIIKQQGEEAFRQMETAAIAEYGKKSYYVIATGGGCVTRPENYRLLHQNGNIIWIQRDISLLPTRGRPLSQKSKLQQMYAIREPMYKQFADSIIINDRSPDEVAKELILREGYYAYPDNRWAKY